MTFVALLTKELRLRLRRERTIWILLSYLLVMGLLGVFYISRFNLNNSSALSNLGAGLYTLLAFIQLFLIVFITPAFTATAINGEKERQTFDLLLCSRLSSFSLVAGKLIAGLVNALLLIAASIPLFSLVFFFGGVGPLQVINAMLFFVWTTIATGSFGLLSSAIFRRPAVSTAMSYLACILWMLGPWVFFYLNLIVSRSGGAFSNGIIPFEFAWNPIMALLSTMPFFQFNGNSYIIEGIQLVPWLSYLVFSLLMAGVFFLISVRLIRPISRSRFPVESIPVPTEKETASV